MKSGLKQAAWIGAILLSVYGMIYADVVIRARTAYLEGEQFWRWSDHPEERARILQNRMADETAGIDHRRAQGRLSAEEYRRDLEILRFEHEQALKESMIKYAYFSYQTAAELFTPPESRWSRLARAKMPLAKERWKAELRANRIPYEDYMLD